MWVRKVALLKIISRWEGLDNRIQKMISHKKGLCLKKEESLTSASLSLQKMNLLAHQAVSFPKNGKLSPNTILVAIQASPQITIKSIYKCWTRKISLVAYSQKKKLKLMPTFPIGLMTTKTTPWNPGQGQLEALRTKILRLMTRMNYAAFQN